MASLKDEAIQYEPKVTKNIAELNKIPVNIELFKQDVEATEKTEAFSYEYIVVNEEHYRCPVSVKKQLKVQLEANPDLKFFSVSKTGSTKDNTVYTVIPLSE